MLTRCTVTQWVLFKLTINSLQPWKPHPSFTEWAVQDSATVSSTILAGCILLNITHLQAEGAMKIFITQTECSFSNCSAPFLAVLELSKANYSCGNILISQVNSKSSTEKTASLCTQANWHVQNCMCNRQLNFPQISAANRFSFNSPSYSSATNTFKQKNLELAQVCSQQAYL